MVEIDKTGSTPSPQEIPATPPKEKTPTPPPLPPGGKATSVKATGRVSESSGNISSSDLQPPAEQPPLTLLQGIQRVVLKPLDSDAVAEGIAKGDPDSYCVIAIPLEGREPLTFQVDNIGKINRLLEELKKTPDLDVDNHTVIYGLTRTKNVLKDGPLAEEAAAKIQNRLRENPHAQVFDNSTYLPEAFNNAIAGTTTMQNYFQGYGRNGIVANQMTANQAALINVARAKAGLPLIVLSTPSKEKTKAEKDKTTIESSLIPRISSGEVRQAGVSGEKEKSPEAQAVHVRTRSEGLTPSGSAKSSEQLAEEQEQREIKLGHQRHQAAVKDEAEKKKGGI